MPNRRQVFVGIITATLILVGIVIIPWQTVYLLGEPQYEYSNPTIAINWPTTPVPEEESTSAFIYVDGNPAISDGLNLRFNVTMDISPSFVTELDIARIAFIANEGLAENFTARYIPSAILYLTPENGNLTWTTRGNLVYYTSGTFNGTFYFLDARGNVVTRSNVPMNLQVSGEDVTYSIVGSDVGIALTLVILAFIVFEFYEKLGDNKGKAERTEQENGELIESVQNQQTNGG